VPSSRLALRLTELARDRGLHEPVHDRLMDAYWAEGRDIGDPETLRELAAEAGLDDVESVFEGDAYGERVAASTAQAQRLGIHAIPAFVLDSKVLLLGAQPREVFEQAFARLANGD
jgi:predicted DsbA family dithiol-disulfide isomerase